MARHSSPYNAQLQLLDAWMANAVSRNPGGVPCRAGCSRCCLGPFDISAADAELVREAVAALPADERREVEQQARAQAARYGTLHPSWQSPYDIADIGEDAFDALCSTLAAEACPCLDSRGRCRIYDSRPLVCRLIGLPLQTPSGDVIDNHCPIKGEFPAYAALAAQPFDLEEFEVEEAPLVRKSARRMGVSGNFETTVAGAIAGVNRG